MKWTKFWGKKNIKNNNNNEDDNNTWCSARVILLQRLQRIWLPVTEFFVFKYYKFKWNIRKHIRANTNIHSIPYGHSLQCCENNNNCVSKKSCETNGPQNHPNQTTEQSTGKTKCWGSPFIIHFSIFVIAIVS